MGHWYGKNRMGKPGVSRGGGVCRHWHVIYRFDRQIVGRSVDLSFGLPLSLSLYVVGTEWPASICIVILLVAKHVQIMSGTRVLELLTESGRH